MDWLRKLASKLTAEQAHTDLPDTNPPSVAEATVPAKPVFCPYCGVNINPPPSRSRKCPSCKQAIAMRSMYGDSPVWKAGTTKTRLFLTEEQAAVFDASADFTSRRDRAISTAQEVGGSLKDFERKELSLSAQHGTKVEPEIVLLSIYDDIIMNFFDFSYHSKNRIIFWYKSRLLYEMGNPNFFLPMEKHHRFELLGFQASSVVTKVSILGRGCCPHCEKLDGKVMSVASALRSSPLPQKHCTRESDEGERGWCICSWMSGN